MDTVALAEDTAKTDFQPQSSHYAEGPHGRSPSDLFGGSHDME